MNPYDIVWIRTHSRDLNVLGQVMKIQVVQTECLFILPWNDAPTAKDGWFLHPDDSHLIAGDEEVLISVLNSERISSSINPPSMQMTLFLLTFLTEWAELKDAAVEAGERLIKTALAAFNTNVLDEAADNRDVWPIQVEHYEYDLKVGQAVLKAADIDVDQRTAQLENEIEINLDDEGDGSDVFFWEDHNSDVEDDDTEEWEDDDDEF